MKAAVRQSAVRTLNVLDLITQQQADPMHVDYIQQTHPDLAKAEATIDSIVQKLVRFT